VKLIIDYRLSIIDGEIINHRLSIKEGH